jgi:hypothetical protein
MRLWLFLLLAGGKHSSFSFSLSHVRHAGSSRGWEHMFHHSSCPFYINWLHMLYHLPLYPTIYLSAPRNLPLTASQRLHSLNSPPAVPCRDIQQQGPKLRQPCCSHLEFCRDQCWHHLLLLASASSHHKQVPSWAFFLIQAWHSSHKAHVSDNQKRTRSPVSTKRRRLSTRYDKVL